MMTVLMISLNKRKLKSNWKGFRNCMKRFKKIFLNLSLEKKFFIINKKKKKRRSLMNLKLKIYHRKSKRNFFLLLMIIMKSRSTYNLGSHFGMKLIMFQAY